jgi:leucyl/phenylalanyl-tRNA--protein transferase
VPVFLTDRLWFPDPRKAHSGGAHRGLLAVGGDLSIPRLLLAYRSGIFPWTSDPVTWWSPDPRTIFDLDRFHVPKSLARLVRKEPFTITTDRAFRAVMDACATRTPDRESTWISPDFIEGYSALHDRGHAHSLECWQGDQLVGGIYGVAIGGFFAGESMFHRVSNASKVALFHLVRRLRSRGFALFDVQVPTPITRSLGAIEIPRDEYLRRLAAAVVLPSEF